MPRSRVTAFWTALLLQGCFSLPPPPEYTGGSNTDNAMDTGTADMTDSGSDEDTTSNSDANEATDTGSIGDSDTDTGIETDTTAPTDGDTDRNGDTESEIEPSCADGRYCHTPPRNCDGTTGIEIYDSNGVCIEGENGPVCYYHLLGTEACLSGTCEDGICSQALCQGVTCNEPPPRRCDGEALLFWDGAEGVCSSVDGTCDYNENITSCDNGCIEGDDGIDHLCGLGDPCASLSCRLPPAAYCDGQDLVTFADDPAFKPGSSGKACSCDYPKSSQECPSGCSNGRCVE